MALPMHLKTPLSLRNIPLEVFYHVFALLEVEEDKATLSSCVVVSRLWRDMALPSLWAKIVLRTNWASAYLTLFRENYLLGHSVRSLTILGDPSEMDHTLVPWEMVHDIVSAVPNLRRLSLQAIDFSMTPTQMSLPLTSSDMHLDTLELLDLKVYTDQPDCTSPFTLITRTLPRLSLGELTISALDKSISTQEPEPLNLDTILQIPIRKLDIQNVPSGDLLDYYPRLSRSLLPGSLRSLSTSVEIDADVDALVAFLRNVGDITHLELDLSQVKTEACLVSQAIFSMKSLSILRLHISYNGLFGKDAFALNDLFSGHASRILEEVHLVIFWDGDPDELDEDYEEWREEVDTEDVNRGYGRLHCLDRFLCSRIGFPALHKVQVTVEGDSISSDYGRERLAEHFTTAVFPKLYKADAFKIHFAPKRDSRPSPLRTVPSYPTNVL